MLQCRTINRARSTAPRPPLHSPETRQGPVQCTLSDAVDCKFHPCCSPLHREARPQRPGHSGSWRRGGEGQSWCGVAARASPRHATALAAVKDTGGGALEEGKGRKVAAARCPENGGAASRRAAAHACSPQSHGCPTRTHVRVANQIKSQKAKLLPPLHSTLSTENTGPPVPPAPRPAGTSYASRALITPLIPSQPCRPSHLQYIHTPRHTTRPCCSAQAPPPPPPTHTHARPFAPSPPLPPLSAPSTSILPFPPTPPPPPPPNLSRP